MLADTGCQTSAGSIALLSILLQQPHPLLNPTVHSYIHGDVVNKEHPVLFTSGAVTIEGRTTEPELHQVLTRIDPRVRVCGETRFATTLRIAAVTPSTPATYPSCHTVDDITIHRSRLSKANVGNENDTKLEALLRCETCLTNFRVHYAHAIILQAQFSDDGTSISIWFSSEGSPSSRLLDPGNATSGNGPGSCASILDAESVEILGDGATCESKASSGRL